MRGGNKMGMEWGGETKKREFVCRSGLIGMTARSACKESEKRSV